MSMQSTHPRVTELLRQVRASLPEPPAALVDVGGGTGQVAVLLAADGFDVTVLDPSVAMLATCVERAQALGPQAGARLRTVQGDAERVADLLGESVADAALCHGVLEVVDDPERAVAALARVLRPGGVLSLVVANRAWLALRAARRGDYREALRLLDDPYVQRTQARAATRGRAWTAAELLPWCERAGLDLVAEHGLQAFAEPQGDADYDQVQALLELERRAAAREPYRSVAEFLHLVARRRAG
jgi:ubiquinone/menaquinone biosynthesis C-methylase UbiE